MYFSFPILFFTLHPAKKLHKNKKSLNFLKTLKNHLTNPGKCGMICSG